MTDSRLKKIENLTRLAEEIKLDNKIIATLNEKIEIQAAEISVLNALLDQAKRTFDEIAAGCTT